MGLTDEDVREILRIIDESELDELRIETPDFRLHVRRGGAPLPPAEAAEPAPPRSAPAPQSDGAAAPQARQAGAEAGPPAAPAPAPSASPNGATAIEAPMLGTFY